MIYRKLRKDNKMEILNEIGRWMMIIAFFAFIIGNFYTIIMNKNICNSKFADYGYFGIGISLVYIFLIGFIKIFII